MKRSILFGLLILGTRFCFAGGSYVPSLMYQVGISTISTVVISVSTSASGTGFGATQMDNPQMVGRASLEIQNIDTSASLWCLPVSTMPVVNGGRKISAGSSWNPNISDKPQPPFNNIVSTPFKFWCLSDGSASTKAIVTQVY